MNSTLLVHAMQLSKDVDNKNEIEIFKKMIIARKSYINKQNVVQSIYADLAYDKVNNLFLESRWYDTPLCFYEWIDIIDFGNTNVLTNIVNNIKKVFCYTSKYYIKDSNIDSNIISNIYDIEITLITDIIDAVGYNSDTLVNIEGNKYKYSLASIYLFEVYDDIIKDDSYHKYTVHSSSIYYNGLKKLRKYIGMATKDKAYKHFSARADMYQNIQGINKMQIIYYKKLAELFGKCADLFTQLIH